MKIAFFTSSLGDTDLAKATIAKLIEMGVKDPLYLIPLSAAANTRTEDLVGHTQVVRLSIAQILNKPDVMAKKQISEEEVLTISQFVSDKGILRAFVGVTSAIDVEVPFQIAQSLEIPCTIAYEYMFKPDPHALWGYAANLGRKKRCQFAVPLKRARDDILSICPEARVSIVGHLCIDRAQIKSSFDKRPVLESLKIHHDEELVFISGTTQPIDIDNLFLDALLFELSKNNYPQIQVRFGLHPGIAEPTRYLQTLLKTCEKYPGAQKKLNIVLTSQMEKKLQDSELKNHPFILCTDLSGADMSQAAEKVAQAVPGALLNESALAGKPSYFHIQSTTPYLPKAWFSENLPTFFTQKLQPLRNPKELELIEPTDTSMANLYLRH